MKVVVVGAGLAGLSAACHLIGRGHEVVVLERDDLPGGRAGVLAAEGFRIDTGPTVLTMVDSLAAVFAAAGADMADHLRLRALDPMYRATFADGSEILLRHGRGPMAEEIRSKCGPAEAAAFGRFCDWLTELFAVEQPSFIERNFASPLDMLRPPGPAIKLARLGGLRRLHRVVSSYFDDPRLQKLFSFQALYAGVSPYQALAIYCVITYMDTVCGVWFPDGGIHAVAEGLEAAATKAGVDFRYHSPVAALRRDPGGRVTGVELAGGGGEAADAVVCTIDLPVAYRMLLPDLRRPLALARARYSPSCALWLAGVRGVLPPGTCHHNIHFGGDWDGSFDALLRTGIRQPDPSILLSSPSLTDPGLAPEGCHVLYALEPVPNLDGTIDWKTERHRLRDDLLARLTSRGYPVGDVVLERFIDPLDWHAQGMERGTPFAISHRFLQTGPFRPANIDRRVPGLVFAGSGTVPGVGVPMVLVSGRLAADRVEQAAGAHTK